MSDQPSVNNVQRGIRCDRVLDAKILKRFRVDDKMTVKDAYVLALQFATRDVELDEADYERILADKRAAKESIKAKKGKKAK